MNRQGTNNKLRTASKVLIVCLAIGIAVILAFAVTRNAEDESTLHVRSAENIPSSNVTAPAAIASADSPLPTTLHATDRISINDVVAGRRPEDLWGFGLSFADAKWMDRQGMPTPSDPYAAYRKLDVGKLREMAKNGDVHAAIIGYQESWYDAWRTKVGRNASGVDEVAINDTSSRATQTPSNARAKSAAMAKLFATPGWQQAREFLWLGVVHGSSYAAERMAASYMDIASVCYDVVQCDSWLLIAWRMGEWDVVGSSSYTPAPGEVPNLTASFRLANGLWARINDERAKLGLSPLRIDLHPSLEAWRSFRSGVEQPIYRR